MVRSPHHPSPGTRRSVPDQAMQHILLVAPFRMHYDFVKFYLFMKDLGLTIFVQNLDSPHEDPSGPNY